ncbi:metallophosphoesterase [Crocinitomix catalasitica]|uniref:metallophosphoesterase n=1 Tax=Crocinitomix catalasitica TaxID=184607 RepID=UPI0004826961|nr:metallophosphoesterase [Crocinitomix catalasitica]
MKRTLVIGDVHGGLKGLKQALKRAEVTVDDQLIFLGDYVDGWSDSAQTIQFLIELEKTHQCEFIYGNHDAWCNDWLSKDLLKPLWLKHGGQATIDSYQNISAEERLLHQEFFNKMKYYIIDDENRLFIHAGFSSLHGPVKEFDQSYCNWDRTLWELAVAVHGKVSPDEISFPKRLNLFHEIYLGHTPTLNWGIEYPWQRMSVWNIDTGAAFKGKVSILDIETKDYWQSDRVMDLYPDEKGRN